MASRLLLLLLLESDNLRAASEDTVLYTASTYVNQVAAL
jgi:hypothetical protein